MLNILKRLFYGILFLFAIITWWIWVAPYWVITGKDSLGVLMRILELAENISEDGKASTGD